MTDEEWEKQRKRAILAAFKTGRPVFADTDGELRYVDGKGEPLADAAGVVQTPIPQTTAATYARALRTSRAACVASAVTAIANGVIGLWRPWYFVFAAVMVGSTIIWSRVHRSQRALYGARK